MARADLLIELVRAGARGDQALFRKALEAMVAEEKARQHHVLADRLASYLQHDGAASAPLPFAPAARNGHLPDFFIESTPQRQLQDLLLPCTVQTICQQLVEEHARADLLRAHNLEPRHRILLAGPPGNGKTSLAEALAAELSLPLLTIRYEAVITSFLGETAVRLSRLFEQARHRRCVLFFDEADVVAKERGDVHETGEIKRVVSSLLLQVDALPSYVVVITATNHPELLDRAAWRRFQVRMLLPSPSTALAAEWFCRFEARLGSSLGCTPKNLAKRLKGLSFSELEQFSLDVQRRYALDLPDSDLGRVVRTCLRQWEMRFTPEGVRQSEGDDA